MAFAFVKDRRIQLDKEEIFDRLLKTYQKECPETIISYLFDQREINRKQFNETDNATFWSIRKIISKNMKEIDDHQKDLDNFISTDNFCQKLDEYQKSRI